MEDLVGYSAYSKEQVKFKKLYSILFLFFGVLVFLLEIIYNGFNWSSSIFFIFFFIFFHIFFKNYFFIKYTITDSHLIICHLFSFIVVKKIKLNSILKIRRYYGKSVLRGFDMANIISLETENGEVNITPSNKTDFVNRLLEQCPWIEKD